MIIVRVWGGLGNQLFQYAFAYALSKRYNTVPYFDITFYDTKQNRKCIHRHYQLNNFRISYKNVIEGTRIPLYIRVFKHKYVNRAIRFCKKVCVGSEIKYIKETGHKYHDWIFNMTFKNAYFDGYWQTEKYFAPYREQLLQEFITVFDLSDEARCLLDEIDKLNSVSLHIRRTDSLVTYSKNEQTSLKYYKKAIELIKTRVENPHLFIFSDDIVWVKENCKFNCDYSLVHLNSSQADVEELICMSRCKHSIIAASSYSWWGAYLKINVDAIHIAPENYKTKIDVIPKGWIVI